ncbi:NAD-dependent epimerase/dehydratase [groundwater metagenome]
MKCLVTGGAGFIGSHIVQRLLDSGHEVVCLDNFDPTYPIATKKANIAPFFTHDNFEFVEGDILDRELVNKITADVEYIFHEADAKGTDIKDIDSKAAGTASITVAPSQYFFTISKAVRDRMYLQNTAVVTIDIGNNGIYDIHDIHINDSLDENFELKSNTSFHWDIPVLKPGEEWGTTYSIKPLETNLDGFTIPAATAQFTVNNKPFSASSNTPKIVVNGPKPIINKTVDKQTVNISEYVTVTVSVNNRGNIGTRFEVKESLPDSVSLTAGSTSLANWSDPNTVLGFSYTIRMNKEGKIELPSAVSNYTNVEYRGTTRAVLSSGKPVITVIDPSKVKPASSSVPASNGSVNTYPPPSPGITASPPPTKSVEPTPVTPGFGSIFALIVLLFATAIRRNYSTKI